MKRLSIVCLVAAACTSPATGGEEAPLPEAITGVIQGLKREGIDVEAERLRSLREFPGCPEALHRHRLHFGEDFANVSRFRTAEDATACLADFRSTALKAGPSGWERMSLDLSAHGQWLVFFPPERTGHPLRGRILAAVQEAEGAAPRATGSKPERAAPPQKEAPSPR